MAIKQTIIVNTKPLEIKLEAWDKRQPHNVTAACHFISTEGEAYMKTHAPWTDQTSAARNGLHSTVIDEKTRWQIVFAHSVSYGIWLEVKNSGKYEIILPTIRHEVDRLRQVLSQFFGR